MKTNKTALILEYYNNDNYLWTPTVQQIQTRITNLLGVEGVGKCFSKVISMGQVNVAHTLLNSPPG